MHSESHTHTDRIALAFRGGVRSCSAGFDLGVEGADDRCRKRKKEEIQDRKKQQRQEYFFSLSTWTDEIHIIISKSSPGVNPPADVTPSP